jgi:hypothetical protein
MKSGLFLFLSLIPTLAGAATLNVTENVKSLECRLGGGHMGNHLTMNFSTYLDPRGVTHSQRHVTLDVSGIYFDSYYNYLVDSVTYDDQANSYTVNLHGLNGPDTALTMQVTREDVPELSVTNTTLPSTYSSGWCVLGGEKAN